ncbi:MAG: hypothetical protein R3213_12760, partial [Flavobacteriaceae bacterium]|nr:hypothetical protein [Flavobacteriaceae bacterium]
KIKFQQDVKVRAAKVETHKDSDGNLIGQTTHWQVLNSALGSPSEKKAQTSIKYGHGIHDERELLNLGVDLGLIDKVKGWHTLTFLNEEEPTKINGEVNVIAFLEENPEITQLLNKQVREIYGL